MLGRRAGAGGEENPKGASEGSMITSSLGMTGEARESLKLSKTVNLLETDNVELKSRSDEVGADILRLGYEKLSIIIDKKEMETTKRDQEGEISSMRTNVAEKQARLEAL